MRPDDSELWMVDSVEDGVATLEGPGDRLVHVPADWLPEGAGEGDGIRIAVSDARAGGRRVELRVDRGATERVRGQVEGQVARLAERDPGGDLTL